MQFEHEAPQHFTNFGPPGQAQHNPYENNFSSFTPPGTEPSRLFQNTFPMPFKSNQVSMQPQDEKPLQEQYGQADASIAVSQDKSA
mmetsp:Transcript_6695/g.9163  ORF Transcript_6695/g.9163 Transcript_6695/m.9163 type:complete len:86 (-) Transcript_6695:1322-1579(-)